MLLDIVEDWQKFADIFGDDLTERTKTLAQHYEEEIAKLRGNIRNYQQAIECFREASNIIQTTLMTARFNMEEIEENIQRMETDVSQFTELLEAFTKTRNIFPSEDEENVDDEPDVGVIPFPDAWN